MGVISQRCSGIANSGMPSRIVLSQEPAFFWVGNLHISVAESSTTPQCGLLTLLDPAHGALRLVTHAGHPGPLVLLTPNCFLMAASIFS